MNDTGYTNGVYLGTCAYCWVEGSEVNYADGDFVEASFGFRDVIQSNYFSNGYSHNPGTTDNDIFIDSKTSSSQVVNNIVERGHSSIMLNWGAAGNVVAYNYTEGEFASGNTNVVIGGISMHGAHPQFNLIEGNVTDIYNPDEIWGSSSHNTNFRNWFTGTTQPCSPSTDSGREAVTCANSATSYSFQASYAENIGHYTWYDNFVGDIVGSAKQESLIAYGSNAVSTMALLPWSASATRSYDAVAYGFTFGYGELSDDGTSGDGCDGSTVTPCHSADAYKTSFLYEAYTFANTAMNCLAGGVAGTCSAALPASFYLASKPTWWSSGVSFPAIGPDLTGGSGPGGHSSLTASNPAQYCYTQMMGGAEGGAGSPRMFNAENCYGTSTTMPVGNPPAAPTNLVAIVQ
jgi:hypothetical protein